MFKRAAAMIALTVLASGCGGSDGEGSTSAAKPKAVDPITAASQVSKSDFPAVAGRTLEQLAKTVNAGPKLGIAVSVFTPGRNRLAFGLLDEQNSFIYGKSAVYIARSPTDKAKGPFPAPADSMKPAGRFRSKGGDGRGEAEAVYSTTVNLPRPGRYAVLVVSKTPTGLEGAGTQIKVAGTSPIPAVGERAPAVDTDVDSGVAGALAKIDTRDPHDDMHKVSFKDVLGKRPVALLMATPALCHSRVCGPVTDIELELQSEYGDRMTFIHQEVYVDNNLSKGLRPPLKAFKLHTEPWLFTVDATGKIAARLEGAFGKREFRRAIEAAL